MIEKEIYDGESIQQELEKYIEKYGKPSVATMADDLTK